jgi:hypothetical protein
MKASRLMMIVCLVVPLVVCTERADDLLDLADRARLAVYGADGTATVASGMGGVNRWNLVLVPRRASLESLKAGGVPSDIAARIDQRTKAFRDQDCAVYVSNGVIAFTKWSTESGAVERPFYVASEGRRNVTVSLAQGKAGTRVSNLAVD